MMQMFLRPPQPQVQVDDNIGKNNVEKVADTESPEDEGIAETAIGPVDPQFITLGSLDPQSDYRMLVTLTNQGAAVARLELASTHYYDVQQPIGYLGQIVVDAADAEKDGDGVVVQIVGKGTPAAKFELQIGDKIKSFTRLIDNTTTQVKKVVDLNRALSTTKPGDKVDMRIVRVGQEKEIRQTFILGQHPIDIIRPESVPLSYDEYRNVGGLRGFRFENAEKYTDSFHRKTDQLSFLTTFHQIDNHTLSLPDSLGKNKTTKVGPKDFLARDASLDKELNGVELRQGTWEVLPQKSDDEVTFRQVVRKIEILKTFRLHKIERAEKGVAPHDSGYTLSLSIEIRNLDTKEHEVAYSLDGPTGLPLEGGWYTQKYGREWFVGYGIRDLVVKFRGVSAGQYSNRLICADNVPRPWTGDPLDFIGVDSKYFQCTLKPNMEHALISNMEPSERAWHEKSFPIRVGETNGAWQTLTDVSFRLLSQKFTLKRSGGNDSKIVHNYTIFAGPKEPEILATYGLEDSIYYGWFWFVAKPLLFVLRTFNSFGLSYAMAILVLTICVRLIILPLSWKQAVGAMKMQKIQPELQALSEKYKDDLQARSRAQSALFKKHKYNPASGCLGIFIQLPIFIGLFKALSVDAGLYGAPLVSRSWWCSDLSAPDMLVNWSGFWTSVGWTGFNTGQGMFCLGPYFNLLPMLTIALFLIQQAVMMPPATTPEAKMQRTMMNVMMVMMGFIFFKVPSGLCVYFIISTLWGLTERQFIPKPSAEAANETYDVESSSKTPAMSLEKRREKSDSREQAPKGFLAKMFQEIIDKGAEKSKLGKTTPTQNMKEKKKKKKK